jgi:hypothetical protein
MECLVTALLIGGCTALGALAVCWRRRRARAAAPAQSDELRPFVSTEGTPVPEGRGLDDLFPGDVLLHDGLDLIVAGVARCTDGPMGWCECRLQDGKLERWLIVRADDPEHVTVGELLPPDELSGEPSDSLEHSGQIYSLVRRGRATVSLVGELVDGLAAGECHYWDYSRPGADRLWIRRGAIFAGQRIPRHLVTLLPGS